MTFLQAFNGINPAQPSPEPIKISGKAINKKLHDVIMSQYTHEIGELPSTDRTAAIQNSFLEGDLKTQLLHRYAVVFQKKHFYHGISRYTLLSLFQQIKLLCSLKIDSQPEADFSPDLFRAVFKSMVSELEQGDMPFTHFHAYADDPAMSEMLGLCHRIEIKTPEDFTTFCRKPNYITSAFIGYEADNIDPLASMLKGNTWLRCLQLYYKTQIGDAGAIAIAEALRENTELTTLNLSYKTIGDEGAIAIAEALESNTTLTELDLTRNNIGEKSAAAFARTLTENSSLRVLSLGYNNIGDKGASDLAEALENNTSLHKLALNGAQIGDKGAIVIAKALKENSTLIDLSLSYNKIQDTGIIAIIETLISNILITKPDFPVDQTQDDKIIAIMEAMTTEAILKKKVSFSNLSLANNPIQEKTKRLLQQYARLDTKRYISF